MLLGGPIFEDQLSNIVRGTIKFLSGVNPDVLFPLEELKFVVENFVRGTQALINTEEYVQAHAGPANVFSLDDAAANLVEDTVDTIVGCLRGRFSNFNEQAVRDALRGWLTRKMQELGQLP